MAILGFLGIRAGRQSRGRSAKNLTNVYVQGRDHAHCAESHFQPSKRNTMRTIQGDVSNTPYWNHLQIFVHSHKTSIHLFQK